MDNDWGNGFSGTLSITNQVASVIEDRMIEFDFDREITYVWNGIIVSHEGNHYMIKYAGYNANIAENQTISFGFNGQSGSVNDVPKEYKLYAYEAVKN